MSTHTLIDIKEFERIAAGLGPCELVRGEVVQLSPGGYPHSTITAKITILLGRWAQESGLGRVMTNEAGVITETGPDTVRGADVVYLSYKRRPEGPMPDGFLSVAPELVVEVVGKGQGWADMVEKTGEYFGVGVSCVWVVDPKTSRVHVFRPDREPVAFGLGDTMADESLLPGFSCRVDAFFAD